MSRKLHRYKLILTYNVHELMHSINDAYMYMYTVNVDLSSISIFISVSYFYLCFYYLYDTIILETMTSFVTYIHVFTNHLWKNIIYVYKCIKINLESFNPAFFGLNMETSKEEKRKILRPFALNPSRTWVQCNHLHIMYIFASAYGCVYQSTHQSLTM